MFLNKHHLALVVSFVLSSCSDIKEVPAEQLDPGSVLAAVTSAQEPSESRQIAEGDALVTKILFGSCADQNDPQPIWKAINKEVPDVFLFLGDNIYADTEDKQVFEQKYEKLNSIKGFQTLRQNSKILATWDDHDYGVNDGGVDYPAKEISRQAMLDFWGEPESSERRSQDWGIYTASYFGPENQRVQIIMLDTRWNRTPLTALVKDEYKAKRKIFNKGFYIPDTGPQATILGEKQWQRLEEELKQPADLRIIASSIQVLSYFTGWESWSNFPQEQARLIELIKTTKAKNVLLISGDTHSADLSEVTDSDGNSLFDLTSSGLTNTGHSPSHNQNRILGPYVGQNYGFIEIDWQAPGRPVLFGVRDVEGVTQFSKQILIDR